MVEAMVENMKSYKAERAFVDLCIRLLEAKVLASRRRSSGPRLTLTAFADQAFPDVADGKAKWQAILGKPGSDKPQRLTLADAINLAEALDRDPLRLMALAMEQVDREEQDTPPNQEGESKPI